MKIKLEVSEKCESTESPWWIIIDPSQMMSPDVCQVAHMITGPFFSRESAEAHLQARRYAFSKRAKVWCHSGYWSDEYKQAMREGRTVSKTK